ncbi:MAG: hypothetical protein VX938_12775 [Myxococcota bacterium]|nr:hypothetical protein [Myxococcota bacterium]
MTRDTIWLCGLLTCGLLLQGCGLMGNAVRTQELVARSAPAPPRWIQGAPTTVQSYYAVGRGDAWLEEGAQSEDDTIEAAVDEACKDAATQLVDLHLGPAVRDATAQVLLPGDNHPLRLRQESQDKVTAFVVARLSEARGGEDALVKPLFDYEERYRVREGGSVLDGLMIRRFVLFEISRDKLDSTIPEWVGESPVVKRTRELQGKAKRLEEQIVEGVDRAIAAADEGRFEILASGVTEVASHQKDLDKVLADYKQLTGTLPPVDLESGEEAARSLRLRAGKEGRNLRLSYGAFVTWSSAREREAFTVMRRALERMAIPSIPTTDQRCGVGVSHWLTLTVNRPACDADAKTCRLVPELAIGRCVQGGELENRPMNEMEVAASGPDDAAKAALWKLMIDQKGGALDPAVEQLVQQHFPMALIPSTGP